MMKNFFQSFLGTLLALFLILAVLALYMGSRLDDTPKVEKGSWLVLDLAGGLLEYGPPSSFPEDLLRGGVPTLQQLLENLDKARVDDRIEGVLFRVYGSGSGWANRQEIRSAIESFKTSGKKIYAYADWLQDGNYYVATACDSVFLMPTGFVETSGLVSERAYVANTLAKLGIHPNVHKIERYKSAAELVQRTEMSKEAREMVQWLMDDIFEEYTTTVARDRGLTPEEFRSAIDEGGFDAEHAVERGLVDMALYWDELKDRLETGEDEDLRTIRGGTYAKIEPSSVGLEGKKTIAVIHAQGMIGGRHSRIDPVLGILMGSETVSGQLRRAGEDDDVAAIVFRVDSPGGESITSDLIGRTVEEVSREKPVVVSMVNVAASGGYSISYRASAIVADPATITGSIGSIMAKFNMRGFYDKIGITKDYVALGEFALAFWDYRDWTEQEERKLSQLHWHSYNQWVEDIARAREMTFQEVDEVGRGRVWTGRQALERGLVDALGGMDVAVETAKEKAGIPADEKVTLEHYPEPQGLIESILGQGSAVSGPRSAAPLVTTAGGRWDPAFLAEWARGWLEEYGDRPLELRVMPYVLR